MNKRQKEIAQLSLDAEKAVLDELEKEYKRALNDINKKVLQFSAMIEQLENAIDGTTDEAQKEILISQRQSKVYQKQYQEALQGQISGILDKMQGDEYATIEQYLKECYEDAYIGTLYDLQGQGIPLIMPIDQAAAVKAITTDSKISKSLYTALGVDVAKLKKTISREITRGIASSRPYAEIARNLAQAAEIPKNRAKLITRTEGHRIQSASNYNACVDAKKRGADVVKQWSAALDARTRASHRSLDGQIVEVDEPFKYGNKTALFPGDFGDPAEDCNCRCRVNQRARWALNESELERLKERAKYYELDKTKDFEDYKQKYLKAVEEETKKPTFVPAKTLDEAETFIKQYVNEKSFGALGVSYKGIDVDVANELNRTISLFFEEFDADKFGGIIAPAGNTKLGKLIDGATAAYMPIRNSFLLNRNSMKNMKAAKKAFEGENAAFQNLLEHPEKYDFSKLSKKVVAVIERAKESGRTTVPKNIEEAITHELGHMIEKKVYSSPLWSEALANMPDYANKISGYAGENKAEYIAESFASYRKGEKVIDPVMIKIFESIKR